MNWQFLTKSDQIEEIIQRSYQVPCLLFKHSSRCSISFVAQHRLEREWEELKGKVDTYFLDLIAYRELSNLIADTFGVRHESPQMILVWKGASVMDASHLDISLQEVRGLFLAGTKEDR